MTEPTRTWRPPTRRMFVAMIAAAAAALAVRTPEVQRTARREQPKPIWIGHC